MVLCIPMERKLPSCKATRHHLPRVVAGAKNEYCKGRYRIYVCCVCSGFDFSDDRHRRAISSGCGRLGIWICGLVSRDDSHRVCDWVHDVTIGEQDKTGVNSAAARSWRRVGFDHRECPLRARCQCAGIVSLLSLRGSDGGSCFIDLFQHNKKVRSSWLASAAVLAATAATTAAPKCYADGLH